MRALLLSREARGLRVPLFARAALIAMGLLSVVLYVAFGGVTEGSATLTVSVTAVVLLALAINAYLYRRLRTGRDVETVGMAGACLDAGLAFVFLGLALWLGAEVGLPAAFVFKTELPLTLASLVVINGLALRPRYPLIVGGGALVAISIAAVATVIDPKTNFSVDSTEIFAGGAIDAGQVFLIVGMVAGVVAATSFTAHVARTTIREGIAREIELARLEEAQLRMVMQEKVAALGRLVAGVSHELNNPLGVLRSGLDTQERVLDKVKAAAGDAPPSLTRLVELGKGGLSSLRAAAERISALESSLRSLSHLDAPERQPVDLARELETVVSTARRETGYEGEVALELDEVPAVHVNAPVVGQALLAIVSWVLRTSAGDLPVVVRTTCRATNVDVVVEGGRLASNEDPSRLFEVRFDGSGSRVRADVALAAARAAAVRHGGDVSAEAVGRAGIRFIIRLPTTSSSDALSRAAQ